MDHKYFKKDLPATGPSHNHYQLITNTFNANHTTKNRPMYVQGELVSYDNGGSQTLHSGVTKFYGGGGLISCTIDGKKHLVKVRVGQFSKKFYKQTTRRCKNCFILLILRNYWYKSSIPPPVIFYLDRNNRISDIIVCDKSNATKKKFDSVWACQSCAYIDRNNNVLNTNRVPVDYNCWIDRIFAYISNDTCAYGYWKYSAALHGHIHHQWK
eukprot:324092_1